MQTSKTVVLCLVVKLSSRITLQSLQASWSCFLSRKKSKWDVKFKYKASWGRKRKWIAREWMLQGCNFLIGNGRNTSFWFNPWLHQGRSMDKYNTQATYSLGLPSSIKVAEFIRNSQWTSLLLHPILWLAFGMKFTNILYKAPNLKMS